MVVMCCLVVGDEFWLNVYCGGLVEVIEFDFVYECVVVWLV